jgi:hypothetical protein
MAVKKLYSKDKSGTFRIKLKRNEATNYFVISEYCPLNN